MNLKHSQYHHFLPLLLWTWSTCWTFLEVRAFMVPPPQNDRETNRVLEDFIWQKIIGAPTDPKKAYNELRSSLQSIAQQSNLEHFSLPDALFSIDQIMSPRSLRRRSSYLSPPTSSPLQQSMDSSGERKEIPPIESGANNINNNNNHNHHNSAQQQQQQQQLQQQQQQQQQPPQQQLFNSPTTSNKYIPEYGAKDLYQLVASAAGSPDKPQPPLPPPPPPPQAALEMSPKPVEVTISDGNGQSPSAQAQQQSLNLLNSQQDILKKVVANNNNNNHNHNLNHHNINQKLLAPPPAMQKSNNGVGNVVGGYSGPISTKHYTMHKVMKNQKKQSPTNNPLVAASNQLNQLNIRPEATARHNIQDVPLVTHHRGQQQAQSQSIYDILPMPTYGGVKGFGGHAGPGGFHEPGGPIGDEGDIHPGFHHGGGGHGGPAGGDGFLPGAGPGTFEAKRTFEVMPIIDQKELGRNLLHEPEPQHYVPVQPPPPPQIIDVIPDEQPIEIVFRSSSARVNVKQVHTPTLLQEVETTRTEEKPQRVLHQLVRPIVQEVVEIIQPYRRVTQEIRPVLEEIRTVVAKQADTQQQQRPRPDQLGTGPGKW